MELGHLCAKGQRVLPHLYGFEYAGAAVQDLNSPAAYLVLLLIVDFSSNYLNISGSGIGRYRKLVCHRTVRVGEGNSLRRAPQLPGDLQVVHGLQILVNAGSGILRMSGSLIAIGDIQDPVTIGTGHLDLPQLRRIVTERDHLVCHSRRFVPYGNSGLYFYRLQTCVKVKHAGFGRGKVGIRVGAVGQHPFYLVIPRHFLTVLIQSHSGEGKGHLRSGDIIVPNGGGGEFRRSPLDHQSSRAGLAGLRLSGNDAHFFAVSGRAYAHHAVLINGHAAGGAFHFPGHFAAFHFIAVLIVHMGLIGGGLLGRACLGRYDHRAGFASAGDLHLIHILVAGPLQQHFSCGNAAAARFHHDPCGGGIQRVQAGGIAIGIFHQTGEIAVILYQLPGYGALTGHFLFILIQPYRL